MKTDMLGKNLAVLRSIHGYTLENVAEKIGISRQAYAKWESGATVPDVGKCALLADMYGVTVDSLIGTAAAEGMGYLPPAEKGKNIWGFVTVGDRGQIVIPKPAREKFGIKGGDRLVVLGSEEGIALVPSDVFEERMNAIMRLASENAD